MPKERGRLDTHSYHLNIARARNKRMKRVSDRMSTAQLVQEEEEGEREKMKTDVGVVSKLSCITIDTAHSFM